MPLAPSAPAPTTRRSTGVSRKAAAFAQGAEVPIKVTVYPPGVSVQVAPEELQPYPDHLPLPFSIGVFELRKRGAENAYEPMLRLHTAMVRMKANITEELGLGIAYRSLRRLMAAGFVRWEQPTPGQYSFCLRSYFQHLANVRNDPEFWETGHRNGNLKRYMAVVSEGVH